MVRHTAALKHAVHGVVGGVPPPNMQLPKSETNVSNSVGAESTHNTTNVEVRPITRVFGAGTFLTLGAAHALFTIWS